MKKFAIIPARSGSKGVKDKNILMVNHKPLMAYTIEAALDSHCFDEVVVSSDSDYYGEIAVKYGASFYKRNEKYAHDNSSTYDAIKDILREKEKDYDYFVLLQPTSPLRDALNIKQAVHQFEENQDKFSALASITKAHKPSILIQRVDEDLSLKNYQFDAKNFKRQDYVEYETNGAIFMSTISHYLRNASFFGEESMAFIMDRSHSLEIDHVEDFELLLTMLLKKDKYQVTLNNVKSRILEKEFSKTGGLTLIGNSIFDNWDISKIRNYKVNNWGVRGSTAHMIQEFVLEKNLPKKNSIILVHFGTNEMIFTDNVDSIIEEINECIHFIQKSSPKKICFLEMLHTNGRVDRDNQTIDYYNQVFQKKIICDQYVHTCELDNEYGMLHEDYTLDGLHLNNKGYQKLLEIVERELSL